MKKIERKMYEYTAVFERNEQGGYTVTVPALPGLVTQGNDLNDAKEMAQDAIKCYIQGLRKLKEIVPREHEVGNFRVAVKA